jgi:tetratricopeptide (TPR) repeat protein
MKAYRQLGLLSHQKLLFGIAAVLVSGYSTPVMAQDEDSVCFFVTPSGEALNLDNICQQNNEQQSEMSSESSFSENVNSLRELASERAASEDYQGAAEAFTEVLRLTPDDASIFAARAISYTEMGNIQNATEDYQEAARLYQSQGNSLSHWLTLRQLEKLRASE